MALPVMLTLRRRFTAPREDDPGEAVRRELTRLDLPTRVPAGGTVAIPVGSRGIANITTIIGATVAFLKESGFEPFIIPAMGSHGGGTAQGQVEVLTSLGITEASTGAPIRASMETVVVGQTERGLPVHVDRHANDADAIVVINRVKPHTEFQGSVESGLLKMLLIGLGKLEGASLYHRASLQNGFATLAGEAIPVIMAQSRVVGGVAILENAREETARIEAVRIEDIFEHETRLLTEAIELMARLPFHQTDLLLVDRMGKNISGAGLDPNVTGRGGFDNWEGRQNQRPKRNRTKVPPTRLIFPPNPNPRKHNRLFSSLLESFGPGGIYRRGRFFPHRPNLANIRPTMLKVRSARESTSRSTITGCVLSA